MHCAIYLTNEDSVSRAAKLRPFAILVEKPTVRAVRRAEVELHKDVSAILHMKTFNDPATSDFE